MTKFQNGAQTESGANRNYSQFCTLVYGMSRPPTVVFPKHVKDGARVPQMSESATFHVTKIRHFQTFAHGKRLEISKYNLQMERSEYLGS